MKEAHEMDLVDEMEWEDVIGFLTLEEAGLEEEGVGNQPIFGLDSEHGDICGYCAWWADGDDSQTLM